MKKIVSFYCIVFIVSGFTSSAQIFRQLGPEAPKPLPVKVKTSPGLESAPTRTTPLPLTNADYFMSSVKVTIKTGSDNKEALSNVTFELAVRDTNYSIFAQNNCTTEFKINTENTIGLETYTEWISAYARNISNPGSPGNPYFTSPTRAKLIALSDVEKYGLSLRIIYKPNFFMDAWKIETVSLSLEFRDGNGNLHATSGKKTITFTNAATFLDEYDKRLLICTADKFFTPLTSFVTMDFSKRW